MEKSTKRTLQVVKSSQKTLQHTASKVQKLDGKTERTLKAVEASQKSAEINSATLEKKLKENSERTIQAAESNQKLVEHTAAKLQRLEANTEKTKHAIDSSRKAEESTANKIQKLDERLSKCGKLLCAYVIIHGEMRVDKIKMSNIDLMLKVSLCYKIVIINFLYKKRERMMYQIISLSSLMSFTATDAGRFFPRLSPAQQSAPFVCT